MGTIAGIEAPLRAAGLTVVELDGWKTRGESDGPFTPLGAIWHHDGMGLGWDNDPTNNDNVAQFMSQDGNNGAQIWVRNDGVVHLLAAGRKWHAGVGVGFGRIPPNDGNTFAVGIETDHTFGNPWPITQVHAIILTSAVLCLNYGWSPLDFCGHKEYAPDRKPDPEGVDCGVWRLDTATVLSQLQTHPDPVPEDDMFTDADRQTLNQILDNTTKLRDAVFSKYPGVVDPNTGKPSNAVADGVAATLNLLRQLVGKK
jgi:hypothetical protein